ncbi:MAG: YiiD C-terminal domain-containing protein [Bacteriovoracaceae bacterium]
MTKMNEVHLIELLNEQIPTSKFMNVRVSSLDENGVCLSCPLNPNHNHLGTAFGGSLATMLILAAYSQVYSLIEGNGHVLIKSSQTSYLIPVAEEIVSTCLCPDENIKETFIQTFKRKSKAQITTESIIKLKDGRVACRMTAQMVAISNPLS